MKTDTQLHQDGTVHSGSERNAARHSAWGTVGVRNVVDHMTIVS